MTDIYTSEVAALAAFELVDALIETLTGVILKPAPTPEETTPEEKADEARREILLAVEAAILKLETLADEGRGSENAINAAKLIRERYPAPRHHS